MNKIITTIIVLAVVGFAGYYLVFNKNSGPAPEPSPTPTQEPVTTTPASTTANIIIQNSAFSPMTITVKAGTKVVWTNKDGVAHTVTSDAGTPQSFTSRFPGGGTFGAILTAPGIYHYHCDVHPGMTGTVIVTQ
ncbi:MAG: cupredoxin domain-containing protein [Candidatus Pacebacteria bacterium]|nr:cupredoxin domain-containing protein [Candidatus Paceibacterota bacterium]MDD5356660.1 cupredoxin domain-containing protein [Candidatus Paceibacterota bacterium]